MNCLLLFSSSKKQEFNRRVFGTQLLPLEKQKSKAWSELKSYYTICEEDLDYLLDLTLLLGFTLLTAVSAISGLLASNFPNNSAYLSGPGAS